MANNEKQLINKIILEDPTNTVLFRCNTGSGWTSNNAEIIKVDGWRNVCFNKGDIILKHPRRLIAGFGAGTPDIIGWTIKKVTHDMVGQNVAIFTGIEVKTPNVGTTKEQQAFIDTINKDGGIAYVAR